jgi:hypothetical protein
MIALHAEQYGKQYIKAVEAAAKSYKTPLKRPTRLSPPRKSG